MSARFQSFGNRVPTNVIANLNVAQSHRGNKLLTSAITFAYASHTFARNPQRKSPAWRHCERLGWTNIFSLMRVKKVLDIGISYIFYLYSHMFS